MSTHKQMKSSSSRSAWLPVAAGLMLLAGACKSDEPTAPSTEGVIQVTVSTTGSELDPDGYTVSLPDADDQSVGINGSVSFQPVTEGDRQLTLSGIASNCSVVGSNPLSVTVVADQTVQATFNVVCVATTGSVVVSTTTTGNDPDPDGYTVTVDGGSAQAIGTNETLTLNGVTMGDRTIELTGVADNCTVTPDNPRTVTVPQSAAVQTDFEITCVSIVGSVEVVTFTTGDDIDPDGYTLAVESATPVSIDVVDTVQVANVLFGDREVELQGIADNCFVANGANPRTVTVPENGLVSETFVIDCEVQEGTISLTSTTTGDDPDPDGYTVSIDGGAGQAVPVNGNVLLSNVAAGDRSLQLSGIATNCSVTSPNPLVVTVPFADTVAAAFDVDCSTLVGSVQVTTQTTGSSLDSDGYSVTVGSQSPVAIGVNDVQTVGSVPVGTRTVELTGLADNCRLTSGDNPRTVSVTDGGTATTTFDVDCFDPISNQIVFDTDRDSGNGEIYVMNPDGTGEGNLTNTPGANEEQPHVSFDGTKIAFVSDSDGAIWVMDADGSNQTSTGVAGDQPAWSPDGSQIVFRRSGSEIWTMNAADGSNLVQLTSDGSLPDWSPDGTKILFNSARDGDSEIYTMSATDGSGVTRLTFNTGADFAASWSPNGSQIAFTSEQDGNAEIYVRNSTPGGSETRLTNNTAFDVAPQWSPNGLEIAFGSDSDGDFEVYTIPAAGGAATNRTNNTASDFEVSWR